MRDLFRNHLNIEEFWCLIYRHRSLPAHPAFVSAAVRYYHKHYGPLAGVVIQAVLLLRELVHLTISLTHPFQANWGAHIRAAKNALAFPTALK